MNFYFVGIIYKEVKWDWNVNCLENKRGIKPQSRSSFCFDGFMKGGQAPDSIKDLSAVISGYFRFWDFIWSICSTGMVSMGSWICEDELLSSLTFCWIVIFKGDASNSEWLELTTSISGKDSISTCVIL